MKFLDIVLEKLEQFCIEVKDEKNVVFILKQKTFFIQAIHSMHCFMQNEYFLIIFSFNLNYRHLIFC